MLKTVTPSHLQVCYHPLKRHLQFLDLLCQSLPLLDQLLPGLLSLLSVNHNVALILCFIANTFSGQSVESNMHTKLVGGESVEGWWGGGTSPDKLHSTESKSK